MRGNSDGGQTRRRDALLRWWLLGMLLALALSPLGCEEHKAPKPTVAAKEIAPSGAIDGLVAPGEVLLFGGVDDLSGLARGLKAMVGPAAARVEVEGLAPALARELAVADPSALALDAPLRFALLDPKAHERPWVWLLRVRSRQALLEALPADRQEAEGVLTYPGPTKKPIYLSFIDDVALFCSQREIGSREGLRPFLVQLAGAELGAQASLVVSASHALARYGKDFEAAMERARAAGGGALAGQTAAEGSTGLAGQTGLAGTITWIEWLAKGLDQLALRLFVEEGAARLAVDLHPVAGGDLAESIAGLSARRLEILSKIPADASFASAWSIDPDRPSELTRSLTSWSLQLSLGPRIDEELVAALNAYWKASSGEMAFAVHPAPGLDGLRVSGLVGIRDGDAARKAQTTLRGAYRRPEVAKLFEQVGMEIRFEPGAYQAGGVSVDRISAKLTAQSQAKAEHDLRELGRTASVFTDLMNSHVAIGDDLGVIAYGREGAPVIETWLAGKMPGGLDHTAGVERALTRAAPGTFMLVYAQPLILARAWELIPTSGGPAPDEGVALSIGASEGALHLLLDIPAAQAKALGDGVALLGRADQGHAAGGRPGGGR